MTDVDLARRFVARNARLLDRHRFAHLIDGAPPEPVLRALAAYANDDGGFGHALEPDLRSPTSQPGAVQHALEILGETGATSDPMLRGACDFLRSAQRPDGGVPFVLASVGDDERAPWWQPSEDSSLVQTASNAAALLRAGAEHPWLDGAVAYCWAHRDRATESAYDAIFAVAFLDAVPDAARAEAALDDVGGRILEAGVIAIEPDVGGDVHTPLDLSPRPGARSRRLFDDATIDAHLDALAAAQGDDGGWSFGWPGWSPAATLDWRGYLTVHALIVLRAHGRLPG
jgi:hypothetical protein